MLYRVLGGLKAEKRNYFRSMNLSAFPGAQHHHRSLTVQTHSQFIKKIQKTPIFLLRECLKSRNGWVSALIFSEKNAKIHTHGQSVSEQFWSIPEAGETFALSHLKTINRCDLYIFQRSNLSWTKVAFYFFHLRERKDIKRKITKASRKHGSNKRIKLEQSLIRQSRRLWETCLLLLFLLLSA